MLAAGHTPANAPAVKANPVPRSRVVRLCVVPVPSSAWLRVTNAAPRNAAVISVLCLIGCCVWCASMRTVNSGHSSNRVAEMAMLMCLADQKNSG